MIDNKKLKSRRLELGLTQAELADLTKEKFKCGSQQGYRKIESGEAAHSKHLPYYCKILKLDLSEVDSVMAATIRSSKDEALKAVRSLSESEQVEIALSILGKVHNKEV